MDYLTWQVLIPASPTTYWCNAFKLPSEISHTTHFINRVSVSLLLQLWSDIYCDSIPPQISPIITPHGLLHHILVYLCPVRVTQDTVGMSQPCNELKEGSVEKCRAYGALIGTWGIGSTVSSSS